jgi:probable F420-dependent oxidoreductase
MKLAVLMRLGPRNWVDVAKAADEAGYDSLWFAEHLILPVKMSGKPGSPKDGEPPIPSDTPTWDPFVVMGFLAAHTRNIRFGTDVFNLGLRHPFVTARALTTADLVSGGRVDFGVGVSWMTEEWQAMEQPFEARGVRCDESMDIIRRLFTEETISHEGRFYHFQPVKFEPKPVQKPWPPFIIGGDSEPAMRRAARLGDGWIPMLQTPQTLGPNLKKIAEMREAAGRSGPFKVIVQASRRPDADELKRWRDAGADVALTMPWDRASEAADSVRRYADEAMAGP